MANHLLIGLGGTGGKVLREFRKKVYEEFRSNEPTNGTCINYLYVDSSEDDLNSREGWKVMGKYVHLKEAQKVSIHGLGMNMFQNLSRYPGIKCFLNSGDIDLMTSKLGPLVTAGIGGQRRRLGRTLFANNLASRDGSDFMSRLKQAVQAMQSQTNNQNVTFHICAGLAGGTGSGSIVDTIAQIRQVYRPRPGSWQYMVYLYLYVPEINVANASHDSGFYQANGYAALSELNAMSVGAYHPYDVTGTMDNFTGQVRRLCEGIQPFDAAFLYSNVDEAGKTLNLANALPASVADFIFQKTVLSAGTGKMVRLDDWEYCGFACPEYDSTGVVTRSCKFKTFGIRHIEYPEAEIEECVTYNYARSAARQLTFNFWQDGIGYGERSIEEIGTGYKDEIKNTNNRGKLMLSNEYLTLGKAIIESPASKRWQGIDITWEQRTQAFADEVMNGEDKKSWFAAFTDLVKDYYENQYRTHGVKKFFEIQMGERLGYAKHIRRHIEKQLFEQWHSGEKSLLEIEKYTRILIDDCASRLASFKEQTEVQENAMKEQTAKIKTINDEWDHIGWLRHIITGASKKVMGQYKTALCNYYTSATRVTAYAFAHALMQEVINELSRMLEGILAYKELLGQILKEVALQADSKCNEQTGADQQQNDRKYDPERVHDFVKQCIANQDSQVGNARAIRDRLVQNLGEEGEKSFVNMLQMTDLSATTDVIYEVCNKYANDALENDAKNDPLSKMVGVNILEKLKQEYNSEERLEQLCRSWVQSAKCYLQFNTEEMCKQFGYAGGGMMRMILLRLPLFPEDQTGFRDKLIRMMQLVAPGFNPTMNVSVCDKKNEIVIVSFASSFPLRYVANVKVLKQHYYRMIADPTEGQLNRMVLHTETFEKPLPTLFEKSINERMEELERTLMIAMGLKLFAEKNDPVTGERFLAINFPSDFGDDWKRVGKDYLDMARNLAEQPAFADQVERIVDKTFAQQVRSNDQKAQLRRSIGMDVVRGHILNLPVCEGNELSTEYQKYKKLAEDIFAHELKEL